MKEQKIKLECLNQGSEALKIVRLWPPAAAAFYTPYSSCNEKFTFIPQLTYADIVVFTFLNSYFMKGKAEGIPEQLKEHPTLSAWYELVQTVPKILQWLKNPPAGLIDYLY